MLVATIFFKVHQFCQQILKNLKFFPEIKKCRTTDQVPKKIDQFSQNLAQKEPSTLQPNSDK